MARHRVNLGEIVNHIDKFIAMVWSKLGSNDTISARTILKGSCLCGFDGGKGGAMIKTTMIRIVRGRSHLILTPTELSAMPTHTPLLCVASKEREGKMKGQEPRIGCAIAIDADVGMALAWRERGVCAGSMEAACDLSAQSKYHSQPFLDDF